MNCALCIAGLVSVSCVAWLEPIHFMEMSTAFKAEKKVRFHLLKTFSILVPTVQNKNLCRYFHSHFFSEIVTEESELPPEQANWGLLIDSGGHCVSTLKLQRAI